MFACFRFKSIAVTFLTGLALSGCTTALSVAPEQPRLQDVNVAQEPPQIIRATGYGAASDSPNLSPTQKHLMGIRASKNDALRNLAEQVQGISISGQTTLGELAVKNDSIRTHVDAFIRGARVISTSLTSNSMFETQVEFVVTPGLIRSVACSVSPDVWANSSWFKKYPVVCGVASVVERGVAPKVGASRLVGSDYYLSN
jgi:outer membrane protein FlgP